MVTEDQEHDARVAPMLHVPMGTTFTGVTHSKRSIPLGKVVQYDPYFELAHKVCWFDEQGKHYEWFNLHNPSEEFASFEIINKAEDQA